MSDTFEKALLESNGRIRQPGSIVLCQENTKYFDFTTDRGVILRISVEASNIVRFRYNTTGYFLNDFSYAINRKKTPVPTSYTFKEVSKFYILGTEELNVHIVKEGARICIYDKKGFLLNEDKHGFYWEHDDYTGSDRVGINKRMLGGESLFGLGDKASKMNLRGFSYELWGTDNYGYSKKTNLLYKNIPFYLGLHHGLSYGYFFDNSFKSRFDFGKSIPDVVTFGAEGGEMNYYFIYGPSAQKVVEDYTLLTGVPELPAMWTLGYHQSKWSYTPDVEVKDVAKEFRSREIPCDSIYLDIDYMSGFRCFTWSDKRFPNPIQLIGDLKHDGFKTVVIIDPGIKIDPEYSIYKEGIEGDHFCKRSDGKYLNAKVWADESMFPDYTEPKTREWWSGLFKELIEGVGVSGVWTDMNEPAVFGDGDRTFPLDVRHDYDGNPCSHRKAHNVYGMQMARATYNGVKKYAYPSRPFVITRSGYAGVQRYASTWTGDNVSTWEHLWIANVQCQRLSISGVSLVGSDIGGFTDTPDGELYVRWLQLGVFHPFCRTHASNESGAQEPWAFGEPYTSYAKKFINLRYKLLPYLYTTAWQYVTKGTPMLRPLSLLAQSDPESAHRMDEFGVGDNILVCPILQQNAVGRWMYLPKGEWYNYWRDTLVPSKEEIWSDAELDAMPIYIRGGAVVPMFPVQQYVGEKEPILTLHVYPTEANRSSVIYEDKGDGYEYQQGGSVVSVIDVSKSQDGLNVTQRQEGEYEVQQLVEIILHAMANVKYVRLEGVDIEFKLEDERGNKVIKCTVPRKFDRLSFHV